MSNAGRKSKYDPDVFPTLAEDYARQGLIDEDIAKKLGISTATFYDYQNKYSEFSEAIKRGKAPVDFKVESTLLKRALGYKYKETIRETHVDQDGKQQGLVAVKIVEKEMPPDVTAIIFWLKNRRPDLWSDRKDIQVEGFASFIDVIREYHKEKEK